MNAITYTYISVATIGFGLALASLPLLKLYALKWGLIDSPGVRKVHAAAVPLTGGTQIYLATTLVTLGAMLVHHFIQPDLSWERQVLTLLAGGTIIYITGLLDDFLQVRSKYKLLVLLGSGAALCGSGLTLDGIHFGGQSQVNFGIFSWPITMLWIATVAVAINFSDGLDSLAGGVVLIAVAVLAAMLMIHAGPSANTILLLALGGALLAFLCHNRHPAKHFMGDSGSMYIGFMIASATVIGAHQIGTTRGFMLPALALSVPLLDTAFTIFRRHFIQRRSIFAAERGHIHHRLMDMGLNQRNTVRVIHGVTVLAVGIGLLSLLAKGWSALGVVSMSVPLLLGLFHIAGSARGSTFLKAIKSKRHHDKELSTYRSTFDEMQLHFEKTTNFEEWWKATTDAARSLDFIWINMPLRNRDGSERIMRWNRVQPEFSGDESLNATIPIEQRRLGGPLRMEVEVAAPKALESAGHRIALFARLMDDHSIATLEDTAGCESDWFEHGDTGTITPKQSDPPLPDALAKSTKSQELTVVEPVLPKLRIAIVHDFLYTYAGAERVLEQMVSMFPHADLFSLFDFLPEDKRHFILNKPVTTSFLQRLPMAKKKHRAFLPLMPLAIEQLDVSEYDLVLSSSYMSAKGVITGPNQLHVCYCHSPARYAWDLQHQYLDESKLGYSPKGLLARSILHYIRNWDARSASGVDHFISNSRFIARRIEKLYRRDASVIYPPVATQDFELQEDKEDFYVTASRLVPYKRIDLVVEAFNAMPDKRLIVIGGGPDLEKIQAMAGKNVRVLGHQPFKRMRRYFQMAKAFLFAAQEDFGIVPVEAMACGTPVIAYGQGGITETVRAGESGIFFRHQTASAIQDAVREFERTELWPADRIRSHAMSFDTAHFRANLAAYVEQAWAEHTNQIGVDYQPYQKQVAKGDTGSADVEQSRHTKAAQSSATQS
jgi:UDP-N-acetylmuramyl pentapeptide phosphotransferase/UDP-N-acetylglucosamine-1-phosphate transferase/glycosyltransferase involved in cell wall biosynthesis